MNFLIIQVNLVLFDLFARQSNQLLEQSEACCPTPPQMRGIYDFLQESPSNTVENVIQCPNGKAVLDWAV